MQRLNLLFILSDQFRAMCLEDDPVRTPNLDRLRTESLMLTQAVSCYPVCSPHRAMLMTGRHPSLNGVPRNVNDSRPDVGLRGGQETWASVLAGVGYQTGMIGKWHLEQPVIPDDEIHGEGRRSDGKVWDAWSPPERRFGFQFWHGHGCNDHHLTPHYWETDSPREQRLDVAQWSAEHETDVALDYLGALDRDRPFALMVSWNPPHQPFDELPDWAPLEHYEGQPAESLLVRPNVRLDSPAGTEAARIAPQYFAAVECIDVQVGRLLDRLAELGLADDTIVVFTSDHGMQLGSHDEIYKNSPWEESMRLPCLIRVPGLEAGTTDTMLTSVDIAPTLLGLCGLAAPAMMQGRDVSDQLLGTVANDARDVSLYYRWPVDDQSSGARGVRTHRHKYVVVREADGATESVLIDLESDPYEQHPLDDPALESELAALLLAELAAAGEDWEGLDWVRSRLREGATT